MLRNAFLHQLYMRLILFVGRRRDYGRRTRFNLVGELGLFSQRIVSIQW